ncbi:MAG: DNA/RNA nuclease SfsA [Rhodocyclaceae bacterium]|nr:DNA/RNA nuclease SfsA [Rhodocyclaceae bacterium]
MRFGQALQEGRLRRRYQRFLADVGLTDGTVTAHCPNTGSMSGCAEPGMRVWLSRADNPARKLAWTWELVEAAAGVVVGVNTGRANRLVREAIEDRRIPELAGYDSIRSEVRYGANSRIDLLLGGDGRSPCYVEVKNVTSAVAGGIGYFPDAVTARGLRHLQEMSAQVAAGCRAVLVFCVQRGDVRELRPADRIDPAFGRGLRAARAAGVEVLALGAEVSPDEIVLGRRLAVHVP